MFLLNNDWKIQRAAAAALTYWGHSTDAESWSCWREAELVQYCVGPGRIDHRDAAVAGGAGHHPHGTLRGKHRCAEESNQDRIRRKGREGRRTHRALAGDLRRHRHRAVQLQEIKSMSEFPVTDPKTGGVSARHLCCGVPVIQQPELHQDWYVFRGWNSFRGLLQQ